VPVFAAIAFLFALAWQEGLKERIREWQNGGPKDVVA
jgi:hypothetical protein